MSKLTEDLKPDNCDLILLENCMLRCKMCHMWRAKDDVALVPTYFYQKFIDDLKDYFGSKMQILFVGGEPLLKPGILDLIEQAHKNGFFSSLTSNGSLIDSQKAFSIMDKGISSIVLSLDSLNPKTHDYLRGVKGTFKKVMRAIKYLKKYKKARQSICIVTTIMKPNLDDIIALADWADEQEAIACISFQVVAEPFYTGYNPYWYKENKFKFLWPDDFCKVENIINALIERKKMKKKIGNSIRQFEIFKRYFKEPQTFVKKGGCHLGYKSLSVNSRGDIYLCFDQAPIGNILRDKIQDIWLSKQADFVRSRIKHCNQHCKSMINCFSEDGFSI